MKYTVLIEESDEGFAASVPGLPGCHSQGATEAEALANITDAIREYLEVVEELARSGRGKRVAVEVYAVNAITMGNIVHDAGLTNEQFRDLL